MDAEVRFVSKGCLEALKSVTKAFGQKVVFTHDLILA